MTEKGSKGGFYVDKVEVSQLEQMEREFENDDTVASEVKRLCIKLVAEKRADERDWTLGKQLHLGNKAGQILILGHHNAGKTTLLSSLKDNPFDEYTSSVSSNYEELIMGNMTFKAFNLVDRNSQGVYRWKGFIPRPDSIVLLIDVADQRHFPQAKAALDNLLKDEEIFNVPIAILGSKYDIFDRKSSSQKADDEESLREELGLCKETMEEHNDGRHLRNFQVYMCNMNDISTFGCAFRFIGKFLNET